mgnify:CR=1 FL=1
MSRLQQVPVSSITPAPFNPKSRTSLPNLRGLYTDIEEHGIMFPLLVLGKGKGRRFKLVDGAGRLAIAKELHLKTVPAVIVNTHSQAQLYQRQFLARRLNSREQLEVFLVNPDAVLPRSAKRAQMALDLFGEKLLREFAGKGASLATLMRAQLINSYLLRHKPFADLDESDRQRTIVNWLLKYRSTREAQRAVQTGIPRSQLWNAISEDRPLTSD